MWKPAESLRWQSEALCAKPANKKYLDWEPKTSFESLVKMMVENDLRIESAKLNR